MYFQLAVAIHELLQFKLLSQGGPLFCKINLSCIFGLNLYTFIFKMHKQ